MSAAATLPDQWFHSWDAHNTRKSPAPFSFPWGTHPSFCPTVWFSKPGTFYGITWKVSLCSLLVSIAKAHEECGNPYSVRFYSELHSESMSHHSITIPSNHNKLLGKFKVLLMKLEYSLKEMAVGKCTSRCNRKTEQNKQKKTHRETKYSWSRYKGIYKKAFIKHHVQVKMKESSRILLKSTKSSIFVQEFQELKASTAREVSRKVQSAICIKVWEQPDW